MSHDPHHDSHADDHAQTAHTEVVDAPRVIAVGLVLFVSVIITVVIVYQFYNWWNIGLQRRIELDKSAKIEINAREYRAESLSVLERGEPSWVDAETVQMPITFGFEQVEARYE